MHGHRQGEGDHAHHHEQPWYKVLWLTGVDYFSTLGYQPGIALLAAGVLSPLATLVLVLVTLFGALPIYGQVAGRSFNGQGSIAMLERLLPGWKSKLFVLVLLGFAATDFIITMTLSAADASKHMVENPLLHQALEGKEVVITLVLLALLAAVFLKGFSEAIGLAVVLGAGYILLNTVVLGRGFMELAAHPEALQHWQSALTAQGDPVKLILAAVLVFPRLALGLSGFETGVSVMPLVKGDPSDATAAKPAGRIRNSKKLLAAAAILMSVLLLCSSFVTSLFVHEADYHEHGEASGRVLAFLAHKWLGHGFGTLYDAFTILILWFAGSSAMAGLLSIVPRYLPRLGMAPRWVAYSRPLVLVLFAIAVLVTLIFHADVEAQAGAYATGVLVLMLSAAVAVTLALKKEVRDRVPGSSVWKVGYFGAVALVFAYTLIENVRERPDGLIIGGIFITAIVVLSGLSRYSRATELRVESVELADAETEALWPEIANRKVNLVPIKHHRADQIAAKAAEIRQHYKVNGPLAFLHVHLRKDRSDFFSVLHVSVCRKGADYFIEVTGAVALANTVAYLSELLDPLSIFLGLTQRNSIEQAFRYLLWGEGETGVLVYEILRRHWDRTPEEDIRPFIYLLSEGEIEAGEAEAVDVAAVPA